MKHARVEKKEGEDEETEELLNISSFHSKWHEATRASKVVPTFTL